jgi:hypothetical protein
VGQWTAELDVRWRELAEDVIIGMKEWRLQHPKATFKEIETALDERWARVRARFLQDAALVSAAADVRTAPPAQRPRGAQCDRPLEARGQATRELTTSFNQPVRLTRSYAVCPSCGEGLFPPG